jgi:hypothetical protein
VESIKVLTSSLERNKGTALAVNADTDPEVGSNSGDMFGWGKSEAGSVSHKLKTARVKVDRVGPTGKLCPDGANGPGVFAGVADRPPWMQQITGLDLNNDGQAATG